MKKYLPLILALLILTFSGATGAYALSTFAVSQGGTGTTTPSGILYGDNGVTNHLNTVTLTTAGSSGPSTFSAGTLNIPQYTGGTGGTGLSTSTPIAGSNVLVYSASGAGSAYGAATSTLTASSPLTGSFTHVGATGALGCQTASGSQAGCLSSTDWTTFNNKGSGTVTSVSGSGGTTGLTLTGGAITGSGTLTLGGTLATANGGTGTTTWQSGSIPYFNGSTFTEANPSFFWNNTNKNLGIGTSTTGAALDIVGQATNVAQFTNLGFGGSSGGAGLLGHTGIVPVAQGDRLGFLLFGYTNGVSQSIGTNAVGIDGYADQAWTLGTNQGSYLDFETTADNSTARTERMRISSNGNVGIGTTSPYALLSVGNTGGIGFTLATSTFNTTGGLNITAGCYAVNGACLSTGGTGTNYFTNSGANTYLNTGSNLEAPSFTATSTTATSSITNALTISNYLNIGLPPGYGFFPQDLIDVWANKPNDFVGVNVGNAGTGPCAQSGFISNGDNLVPNNDFTSLMNTNTGWTGIGGCNITSPLGISPESTYLFQPTWDESFALGTTTTAAINGKIPGFDFYTQGATTPVFQLTNANTVIASTTQFSIGTSTPSSTLQPALLVSTGASGTQMGIQVWGKAGGTGNLLQAGPAAAPTTFLLNAGGRLGETYTSSSGAADESAGFTTNSSQGAAIISYGTITTVNRSTVGTSAGTIIGAQDVANGTNGSGTDADEYGVEGIAEKLTGAGTITNAYAGYFPAPVATAGTITNAWSLGATGRVQFSGLTPSSGLQTGVLCLGANSEIINDSVACLASARRYKEDITGFAPQTALSQILALSPVTYLYKPDFNGALQSNPNYSRTQLGLIADDVGKVNPAFEVVETATTTFEGKTYAPGTAAAVDYNEVDAALVGAVQQLHQEILSNTAVVVSDAEDEWQNAAIAVLAFLFVVYVIYNEIDKRRK